MVQRRAEQGNLLNLCKRVFHKPWQIGDPKDKYKIDNNTWFFLPRGID